MELYTVDVLNSKISFNVRYLLSSKVKGYFTSFNGIVKVPTNNDITDSEITFEIDVASITTNESIRDQHLISADFFHADLYPKIHFKKTHIYQIDDKHAELHGELQIKDIKRPVVFHVELIPLQVNQSIMLGHAFHCKSMILRTDYNLVYGSLLENSSTFIAKEVAIDILIQLQKN